MAPKHDARPASERYVGGKWCSQERQPEVSGDESHGRGRSEEYYVLYELRQATSLNFQSVQMKAISVTPNLAPQFQPSSLGVGCGEAPGAGDHEIGFECA